MYRNELLTRNQQQKVKNMRYDLWQACEKMNIMTWQVKKKLFRKKVMKYLKCKRTNELASDLKERDGMEEHGTPHECDRNRSLSVTCRLVFACFHIASFDFYEMFGVTFVVLLRFSLHLISVFLLLCKKHPDNLGGWSRPLWCSIVGIQDLDWPKWRELQIKQKNNKSYNSSVFQKKNW